MPTFERHTGGKQKRTKKGQVTKISSNLEVNVVLLFELILCTVGVEG